jgi:hypothetical protein
LDLLCTKVYLIKKRILFLGLEFVVYLLFQVEEEKSAKIVLTFKILATLLSIRQLLHLPILLISVQQVLIKKGKSQSLSSQIEGAISGYGNIGSVGSSVNIFIYRYR